MKYVSLFSGIDAASVAWHPLGWEPVAFAEIEPFPAALLAHTAIPFRGKPAADGPRGTRRLETPWLCW